MDGYEIEKLRSGHKNLSNKNQNNVAFANPAHLFHNSDFIYILLTDLLTPFLSSNPYTLTSCCSSFSKEDL